MLGLDQTVSDGFSTWIAFAAVLRSKRCVCHVDEKIVFCDVCAPSSFSRLVLQDDQGWTALMHAIHYGRLDIGASLIHSEQHLLNAA